MKLHSLNVVLTLILCRLHMNPSRKRGRPSHQDKYARLGEDGLREAVPNFDVLVAPAVLATSSAVQTARVVVSDDVRRSLSDKLPPVLSHPLGEIVRAAGTLTTKISDACIESAKSFWTVASWKTTAKRHREAASSTNRRSTGRIEHSFAAAADLIERETASSIQAMPIVQQTMFQDTCDADTSHSPNQLDRFGPDSPRQRSANRLFHKQELIRLEGPT